MPSAHDVHPIQDALKDLATLMIRDLYQLYKLLTGRSPQQIRDALVAASPGLVNPYASSAAKLTATWYDQLAPNLDFKATPAPLPDVDMLAASARWATAPLFQENPTTEADPLTRLAGSMQRRVFDASRETVTANAEHEPGTRWARYASANACAFCRLMATRGAVYRSEVAATTVVGRAGSGRTRGTQSLGDKYHDHCRCVAVPIRPGDSYAPPDYVGKWEKEYYAARRAVGSGAPKDILREMRKNDTQ